MQQLRWLIRYLAYPVLLGACLLAIVLAIERPFALVWLIAIALAGAAAVALLERLSPFDPAWQQADADVPADVVHAIVNLTVMHSVALVFMLLRDQLGWAGLGWPSGLPLLAQMFIAGVVIDVSLYAMHRLSHHNGLLWRLHSIHHSPRRLYWLNGERRHPLHAAVMAGPALLVLGLAGAPALVVAGWFALLTVHLAFQHANLDYRVGPLRHVLGVAEVHRWHHREDFEDAQVNFGEFWMVWDRLFGTFLGPQGRQGTIGIEGDPVPVAYMEQLAYPFRARDA